MMIDLIALGAFISILCFIAYMYTVHSDLKKRQIQVTTAQERKKSEHSFHDMLDNLPFALEQTRKMYNEVYTKCENDKMPKEEAMKLLEPIDKRIKMMETVQNWEPAARIGADVGDKAAQVIKRTLDNFGKGMV